MIAKHEAGLSKDEISQILGCSKSIVKRDLRHYHATGEARSSQQGKGKKGDRRWVFAGANGQQQLDVLQNVKEAGDAEDLLKEVWTEFLQHSRESPAYRTLCEALAQLEYTRKRLSSLAREFDEQARNKFLLAVQQLHGPHQLVFMDETARDERTLNRRYGYSKKGTPAAGSTHFLMRGKRYSALGPFTMDGFLDWKIVEGGFDADS